MKVRPLRLPEDLDPLRELDATSRSETVLEVTATDHSFVLTEVAAPAPVVTCHDFVSELTEPDPMWTHAWVAVDGDRVLGIASVAYHRWNRRQILWGLYVDAPHRGRGIGRALVEVALDDAATNGARQLWLETQSTNVSAVRAYRAMGFELVGLDRTLYDGVVAGETALYFARPV